MATKSISKNIIINERPLGHAFVNALCESEDKPSKEVQSKWKCREITGDKIKELFGEKK